MVFLSFGILQAQADDLDAIFETRDGMLRFSYSSEWTAQEEDGSVYIEGEDMLLGIFSSLTMPDEPLESVEEFVEVFINSNESYQFEQTRAVTLPSGMTALRADFTFSGQVEGTVAFLLGLEADTGYVLILANGENMKDLTDTVYTVADTVELGEAELPNTTGTGLVLDLGDGSPDDWTVVVDAMRDVGLIDGDGELLFEAEMTSTSLGGPVNIGEDSESTYPNSAGGALLSFRPGEETNNICGFITRVIADGDAFDQVLVISVDADDNLLITGLGYVDESLEEAPLAELPSGVIFHNPTYFHYVLNDNLLTVFVNGEALIEDLEVPLPEPDKDGLVAANAAGALLEFSCVMTSAWIYGFEAD
jgi:hypothetical protein